MAQTPRTEFAQALRAIATERGLDANIILEALEQALVAAYKRDAKEAGEDVDSFEYETKLDSVTGEARILRFSAESSDEKKDVTPPGFGRIAAQTAKQVIHQKIREAEKGALMEEYEGRVGNLVSGTVLRFDGPNVRIDMGRSDALMPAEERISSERLNPGQRLTLLLKRIDETPRGKQIILSRADPEFVRKIFAREVPEISSGSVEVKGIVREAGVRTKLAVYSNQPGVDPVGSCVGQKGVRVQAVTNELGGERVDIIPWSQDESEFIKASLAPVDVSSVSLDEERKEAAVLVPEDQLSLAIGKDGLNVGLASQLTGWRIEVVSDGTRKEKKEEDTRESDQVSEDDSSKGATDEKDTELDEKPSREE